MLQKLFVPPIPHLLDVCEEGLDVRVRRVLDGGERPKNFKFQISNPNLQCRLHDMTLEVN